ncbi:hypothetical protein RUE5091_02263 [Ruegeria denitrificans]|uniref:Stf0 sulfotransferase n=1 Tax=Ruegeria denitrificans TaxID=1715692 RepID=A0A0P1IAF2_9RHOB|nr:hypothetical protein [Ruegeria denitrificans]CUK01537.1 hypothetical protein RUE5091_02263 [Ruegeria denitrificans]
MIDVWKTRAKKWRRSVRKALAPLRARLIPQSQPETCIIVASNGRSGSTLTFTTLIEAMEGTVPKARKKATFFARMKDATFQAPCVYKTHDFPQTLSSWPENTRVIFCFGSTKDSALSVYTAKEKYGDEWIDLHFHHLHATGTYDELFERDVLQQARQVKEWATFEDVPVLCVHYDAIWDHKETISRFTGWKFNPPERRERAPKNIPADLMAAADRVYGPIDAVIDQLPKCFIASRQFRRTVEDLPITD